MHRLLRVNSSSHDLDLWPMTLNIFQQCQLTDEYLWQVPFTEYRHTVSCKTGVTGWTNTTRKHNTPITYYWRRHKKAETTAWQTCTFIRSLSRISQTIDHIQLKTCEVRIIFVIYRPHSTANVPYEHKCYWQLP